MNTYKIYANAKSYSLWEVDDSGKLTYHYHDFEGADIINYIVVDTTSDSDDSIFESEDYNEVKKFISNLE